MTTPAAELNKALWLDKTAFGHLKKTEQDVDKLRSALPKEVQASLVLSNRVDPVTPDLIYALTVHLNKEKEAGRPWPYHATRDQARECIKAAKELLHNINLAQTVASTVKAVEATASTVDAHGVRIDGLDEHVAVQKTINAKQNTINAEQKTFNAEQKTTNAFVKKELDARKQDKNDLKMRLRNVEGDVREQKGKEAIVERVLTFNKETKEEELQRSLSPCGNQIHGAYHFTAPAC